MPCQNAGTCTNTNSSPYYACNCTNGFTGTTCGTGLNHKHNIFVSAYLLQFNNTLQQAPCSSNPCQNSGTCVDTSSISTDFYECFCNYGFNGTNCDLGWIFLYIIRGEFRGLNSNS